MPAPMNPQLNRRNFLTLAGMGLGGLTFDALAHADNRPSAPLSPRAPHFQPRARRIVHFFLNGGPSHVDTFDPKPLLRKYAGESLPGEYLKTERRTGAAFPSPFEFKRHGQSGLEISELFQRTAAHADDIAVVRSMYAQVPNHEPSLMLMNCGDSVQPRPSFGAWSLYGLGSENQNLPGFVAMCPGGMPIKDSENWQAGFLPGVFQGTFVDPQHREISKLIENIRSPHASTAMQRRQLDLLRQLNDRHRASHPSDPRLDARIESFELAFRMQMEATDAFDISREPAHIRAAYGDHVHGRQTLIARRLLERGVRVVQLWHGAGQPWDHHDNIESNLRRHSADIDGPIAAFISDLKQRGLFEDTLILWGGEFGRTPTVELGDGGKSKLGRDHNHYGFSVWMAGGGVRGGQTYGATDEFGFRAVDRRVSVHDLHATLLHLLGFDHEQLTYRHAGRDFRLTDVSGDVIRDIVG
jgi:hypothetical protein